MITRRTKKTLISVPDHCVNFLNYQTNFDVVMPLDPFFSKISISHLLLKFVFWNFACEYLEPRQVFYVLMILKKYLTLSHKSAFKKISKLPPPELRLLFHWNTSLFKSKDFFSKLFDGQKPNIFFYNREIFLWKKPFQYWIISP